MDESFWTVIKIESSGNQSRAFDLDLILGNISI